MSTSIFFNGRVIHVPGSYSEVDASSLESVGLGASGIVAVLGTAEGGLPVTAIEEVGDFLRFTNPEKLRQSFRSGDLREVGDILFAPSKDADIQAGAQEVVAMKVNPATQSEATFANTYGDSLVIRSKDYGAFTGQIQVAFTDTDPPGDARQVTVTFEDQVESVAEVGGDNIFTLSYRGNANAWETMTAAVAATGDITCAGSRSDAGLDSAMGTQPVAPVAVQVVSSNGADTQTVELWGLNGSAAVVKESLTLAGTTPVLGTQVFAKVLGARATGAAGTVTVAPTGGGTTIVSITSGTTPGLRTGQAMFVAGTALTAVADAATTKTLIIEGKSLTGAVQREKLVLTGTAPVTGTATWTEVTLLIMGDIEAAKAITLSATVAKSLGTVQLNLTKAADYFNSRQVVISAITYGFTFTIVTGQSSFAVTDLDVSPTAVSCFYPTAPGFKANLYAILYWLNSSSQLVEAEAATGAKGGFPDNTTIPVFLAGGSEGAATTTEWQLALNWLKRTRVNSVVVLTADPAVHAMLDAHCAYMCGIGRNERDGFVGLMDGAMTGYASKTEVKAQIVALNTRHIRACAQGIPRYNTAGEKQTFTPPFQAALAAGMQAGAPAIGTSLTYKYANTLGFEQHSTWNPTDDSEEMIVAGLLFLENVEGVGRRWVRNVTTHLSSNNIAFTEGSVNQAVNYAAYNFRTNMESAVGKRGFAGTVNAAKGVAVGTLGLLVDSGALVQYRSLFLELIVDVLEVSVEMAPVIPINFVKSTLHLVTVRQTAA